MSPASGFGDVVERLRRSTVLVRSDRQGAGSGLVVDAAGVIATNAHVLRSHRARIQLWDGRDLAAGVVAVDRRRDLATLTVDASGLPAAEFGDSDRLRVGQLVVAVGNPLGFIGALTTGVVHAVGPVRGLGPSRWVQADLRLAPGNSGGPLADAEGRVVGLNTMIAGRLALARPANDVRRFVVAGALPPALGIVVRPVNVAVNGSAQVGLAVLEVVKGGPADAASLMAGDILLGADGVPFASAEDLGRLLELAGGSVVHFEFIRGGRSPLRRAAVVPAARRSVAA